MSGLVTGLQNQVQRFESACDLWIVGFRNGYRRFVFWKSFSFFA